MRHLYKLCFKTQFYSWYVTFSIKIISNNSLFLPTYVPKYLSNWFTTYLHAYLPIYYASHLFTYIHAYLPISSLPTYFPALISTYLLSDLPTSTPAAYLPTDQPTLIPTYHLPHRHLYLSTYLHTFSTWYDLNETVYSGWWGSMLTVGGIWWKLVLSDTGGHPSVDRPDSQTLYWGVSMV